MILKKGEDITADVTFCRYNSQTQKYEVTFKNGKTYFFSYQSIDWLQEPAVLNPALLNITHGDRNLFNIQAIYVFKASNTNYWRIHFSNGSERNYDERDLKIVTSCLSDAEAGNCFEYLRQIASINELHSENGTVLLAQQYDRIDFVGADTALAIYLNPQKYKAATYKNHAPIFPFGGNASQFKAVKTALKHQISVIQGPPGTGKTQTILNIISNLLVQGKTVLVVSNNNSATANVLEKLSSKRYGMGFLLAPLGNSANKAEFICNQTGSYPDLTEWNVNIETQKVLQEKILEDCSVLSEIFEKQERLAKAKQELHTLQLEVKYFEQYCAESVSGENMLKVRRGLRSSRLMKLWQECYDFSEKERGVSFWYKFKSVIIFGLSNWKFFYNDLSKIITLLQSLFYRTKQEELSYMVASLENELDSANASKKMDELIELSMKFLRSKLFNQYGNTTERKKFALDDLWKRSRDVTKEYPIILSTTFSSRSSLGKDMVYDYLIMDEASQVDVATGALALSCSKNVVIVGDTKQLPNVVSNDMKKRSNAIMESFHINQSYSFAKNSFLKSICSILTDVPQTLLREHYRCHPKIIGFCNQKFYNNELIIMSEDNGETDALSVFKTVVGNHRRDNLNQRQIDVICQETLPKLKEQDLTDIGIIAPYNDQVNALKAQLGIAGIDVATVHKFQGREKDTIVLTPVDDVVTHFTDDPYLLNVAISRAKKRLCLVVSGNEQPADSNIGDLISYIEYNNFEIVQSEIYSIFDYLYQQYTESRLAYLKKRKRVSEFDSENLMYGMIKDVLSSRSCTALDVIFHQPLNMLIRDPKLLSDAECRYAMNASTHLDFLIYNKISKKPVLAIEVDGFHHHKNGTVQAERDKMKNNILELYNIPYLRFSTDGSGEMEKLEQALKGYKERSKM
jgi:Superfamily I DNA and RNA helicases and helicase subunits